MSEIAKGCPKCEDPTVTCYCNDCLDRACDENGVPRITGKAWDRIQAASPEGSDRRALGDEP